MIHTVHAAKSKNSLRHITFFEKKVCHTTKVHQRQATYHTLSYIELTLYYYISVPFPPDLLIFLK